MSDYPEQMIWRSQHFNVTQACFVLCLKVSSDPSEEPGVFLV